MSLRLANAVDVLISGATGVPSLEHLTATILRHTKTDAGRAAEIAKLICSGHKVMFQLDSEMRANQMAQDLRISGFVVSIAQ